MIENFEMKNPMLAVAAGDAYLDRLGMQSGTPKALGRIQVSVLRRRAGRGNSDYAFADPPTLEGYRNATGRLVYFNRAKGGDGVVREPYFPAGRYDLQVTSDYYRPIVLPDVPLGAGAGVDAGAETVTFEPLKIALEPGYNYPFPTGRLSNGQRGPTVLRGSVAVQAPGGPLSADGFQIAVSGADEVTPYTTEANGQWLMLFPVGQKDTTVSLTVKNPKRQLNQVVSAVAVKAGLSVSVPPIVFKVSGS